MNRRNAVITIGTLFVAGCTRAAEPAGEAAGPLVSVYKNESCGCCKAWVEHLQQAGFAVEVHDLDNLGPTKERVGIPVAMGSCHTAEVGGYFVEGHVPADDIKRLLREQPKAKGVTVPAMPRGDLSRSIPFRAASSSASNLASAFSRTSAGCPGISTRLKSRTAHTMAESAAAQSSSSEANTTQGTVHKVDHRARTVTIAHGPVPSLNWPAMTMAFQVQDEHTIFTLKEGDEVEFSFTRGRGISM